MFEVNVKAAASLLFAFIVSSSAIAQSPQSRSPAAVPAQNAQVPAPQLLTNSSIVQMKEAGMSDGLIISTIHTQPGNYAVALGDMLALKKAGVSDAVIVVMQQATANAANVSAPPQMGPSESSDGKPRVYLSSSSKGNTWGAVRDQTMELTKDFERDCPAVHVTINQNAADYSVALNHIELGAFVRNNQIEIADRNGDVVGRTSDGGSIAKGVKKACAQISVNWDSRAAATPASGH